MNLRKTVRALATAQTTHPPTLQGQQRHFAQTLPRAERALKDLLSFEFSMDELRALTSAVNELVADENEEVA